jgi:hypothetical protein
LTMRWVDDLFDDDHVRHQLTLQRLWWSRVSNVSFQAKYNRHGDKLWTPIASRPNITGVDLYRKKRKVGVTSAPTDKNGEIDADLLANWLLWLERGTLPDGEPIERLGLIFDSREDAVALRHTLPERFRGPVVWRTPFDLRPSEDLFMEPFPADHIYPGTDKYAYYESLLPKALR